MIYQTKLNFIQEMIDYEKKLLKMERKNISNFLTKKELLNI